MQLLRSGIRWYRQIMPWPGVTLAAIFAYLLTEAAMLPLEVKLGWQQPPHWWASHNPIGAYLCLMGAMVYGLLRAIYFSPVWRVNYRRWLATVPWNAAQPLPDGPVLLVPQDLIPTALLTLGSLRLSEFHQQVHWYLVGGLASGAWLLASLPVLFLVGPRWIAFAVSFAAGGVIRFAGDSSVLASGLYCGMLALTQYGHYRALQRFHLWDLNWLDRQGLAQSLAGDHQALIQAQSQQLGWPHEPLAPQPDRLPRLLTPLKGGLLALLIAWQIDSACVAIEQLSGQQFHSGALILFVSVTAFIMAIARCALYMSGHAAPLGLFGRLATGRLIIPGYDQIFLAPATVLIWTGGGAVILQQLQVPPVHAASGLLLGAIFFITTMPPDLRRFHLTGNHRLTPTVAQQSSGQLLRQ